MSTPESVGPYRLGQRVGTSVWKVEDTRSGKPAALKVLTKQLPKDAAKREAMIREVRVAAALYHAFLVPILEIVAVGDNLLMVMESLDAQSFSRRVDGKPMSRADVMRFGYQLADAIRFLHSKGLSHGNINTDSVMITSAEQVKLGGLNLFNILPRPDGPAAMYKQKSADARSVAYMAPEQITAPPGGVDGRSDIYSFGVVMYEMGTGRLPYQATNATDFARAIVDTQPISPKAVNPAIDNAVLGVLGRCLFKDPFKRHKEAKLILEDIAKLEPDAARAAADVSSRPVTSAVAPADSRESILFMADVANYAELEAASPGSGVKAAARMQQILGEAVYLFDGEIVDPFGRLMIAELPDVEKALEAARKGEFDFSPEQQGDERAIPVRLLLHAGAVTTRDGVIVGDAITRGQAALQQLPPRMLYLTEDFMKRGRTAVRVRDAGARGGVKLYTIVPSEATAPAPVEEASPEPEVDEVLEESSRVSEEAPRTRPMIAIAVSAAVILLALLAGAYFLFSSRQRDTGPAAMAAPAQALRKQSGVRRVAIAPFAVDGGDASLAQRSNAVRLAAMEILRTLPDIELSDTPGADVLSFGATVRNGTAGPELLAAPNGVPAAAAVPFPDAATGIRTILDWATKQTSAALTGVSASPEALNAFAAAATATAANDSAGADAAIRAAVTADPDFFAAQMLAMRLYSGVGKTPEAIAAAKRVVALRPSDAEAARTLARLTLGAGDLQEAFAAWSTILRKDAGDVEALTHVARYAASSGDTAKFSAAIARLRPAPPGAVAAHPPDLLAAAGKMGQALDAYYEIEANTPANPAIALKIGRISVLRRSMPIAELELKKLEQGDPIYGLHLLRAYMAATKPNGRGEAESELARAGAASTPGDDFWTSTAEIYAMLGDSVKTLESLQKAATRKEPTAQYILTNPLFGFLESDPQFQQIRASLVEQQNETRAALAQIAL